MSDFNPDVVYDAGSCPNCDGDMSSSGGSTSCDDCGYEPAEDGD